jgi:hypothetical protein
VLGLPVELAPQDTWSGRRGPPRGIDPHTLHRPEVDDDAAVAGGEPGDVVAASADRDQQVLVSGERSAAITSATPVQRAITAGQRSTVPFQTRRARS